jgi:hypothetical protein
VHVEAWDATAIEGEVLPTRKDWQVRLASAFIDDGHLAVMSGSEVKVYVALLKHADWATGACFVSNATLHQETGVSLRHIPNVTGDLNHKGYIRKQERHRQRPDKGWENIANRYTVLPLPAPADRRGRDDIVFVGLVCKQPEGSAVSALPSCRGRWEGGAEAADRTTSPITTSIHHALADARVGTDEVDISPTISDPTTPGGTRRTDEPRSPRPSTTPADEEPPGDGTATPAPAPRAASTRHPRARHAGVEAEQRARGEATTRDFTAAICVMAGRSAEHLTGMERGNIKTLRGDLLTLDKLHALADFIRGHSKVAFRYQNGQDRAVDIDRLLKYRGEFRDWQERVAEEDAAENARLRDELRDAFY